MLFALQQVGFAQREVLDRVIAVVDENIILQSELDQMAANFALQNNVQPVPGSKSSIKFARQHLISWLCKRFCL